MKERNDLELLLRSRFRIKKYSRCRKTDLFGKEKLFYLYCQRARKPYIIQNNFNEIKKSARNQPRFC